MATLRHDFQVIQSTASSFKVLPVLEWYWKAKCMAVLLQTVNLHHTAAC